MTPTPLAQETVELLERLGLVNQPLLHRIPDVQRLTGIGRSRIYELMASGELESVKVGKSRLVPHEGLVQFVDRLRSEGAA